MEKSLTESNNVKNPAPAITGIAIKNENLAASFGWIPIIIDKEIVIPLLEIPGIIAKSWKKPIITEDLILRLLFDDLKK